MKHFSPSVPRLASTLLLLASNKTLLSPAPFVRPQEGAANDINILMVKRHAKARFMAEMYVFPGGGVEPEDWDLPSRSTSSPGQMFRSAEERAAAVQAGACRLAALRELAEETSCVLCGDDRIVSVSDWQRYRSGSSSSSSNTNSIFDVSSAPSLVPLGRWVTPVNCKYRYDTYFYGAVVEEALTYEEGASTSASCDGRPSVVSPQRLALQAERKEVSDVLWVSPLEALCRHENGEDGFSLPPPTYHLLRSLAAQPSLEALKQLWQRPTATNAATTTTTGVEPRFDELPEVKIPPVTPCSSMGHDGVRCIQIPEDYFCGLGEHSALPRGHYQLPNQSVDGKLCYAHLYVGNEEAVKHMPAKVLHH